MKFALLSITLLVTADIVFGGLSYWVPPLDEPGVSCKAKRIKIPNRGTYTCIPVNNGICRDSGGKFGEWRFGVDTATAECTSPQPNIAGGTSFLKEVVESTYPVLIDPATTPYPVSGTTYLDDNGEKCTEDGEAVRGCNYAGTTHICIGENIDTDYYRYSEERPYLFFYNEKTHTFLYQLVCDGVGTEGKLPQMKMVDNGDLANEDYVNYPVDVVKYKKGSTSAPDDKNELWKMSVDWNGYSDPQTKQKGQLAAFIGVAHPNLCTEYVGETTTACWEEDCIGQVPTSSDQPYDNPICPNLAREVCDDCWCLPSDGRGGTCPEFNIVDVYSPDIIDEYRSLGAPDMFIPSSSQALCYPNIDHIDLNGISPPNVINGRIPIPFLPGGGLSLPLCTEVPGREADNPNAVCGFMYRDADGAAIPIDGCDESVGSVEPTSYDVVTYSSRQDALNDNAFVSHESSCGYCSSAQDLSVFLDTSIDLFRISFSCFTIWADDPTTDLVQCIQDFTGLTENCALAWAINIYFNSLPTATYPFSCIDTCLALIQDPPNNADCTINACLQCDEDINGPVYTQLAGRSRRNAGILTDITRPCDEIAEIRQDLLCNL